MNARLAFASLALLTLTAFAPAPFPKRARDREPGVSLKAVQGTWRIVRQHYVHEGRFSQGTVNATGVRVRRDRWEYLVREHAGAPRDVVIDHSTRPARIAFYRPGGPKDEPTAEGLIRQRGDKIELIYSWGVKVTRPDSFEPTKGLYLFLILERND